MEFLFYLSTAGLHRERDLAGRSLKGGGHNYYNKYKMSGHKIESGRDHRHLKSINPTISVIARH